MSEMMHVWWIVWLLRWALVFVDFWLQGTQLLGPSSISKTLSNSRDGYAELGL
jgi:hypothetical protein